MFCVKCHAPLGSEAKFCPKCGTARPQVFCTKCGEKLNASAKFCLKCGAKVVVTEAEPKSVEPHDAIPPIAPNPKLLLWFAALALAGFSVLPMALYLVKLNSFVMLNIASVFGGACRIAAFSVLGFHKGMRGIVLPGLIGTTLTFGSMIFNMFGGCAEIGGFEVYAWGLCVGNLFILGALLKMWHLVTKWAFWPSILGFLLILWLSVSEIILLERHPAIVDFTNAFAEFHNKVRWSWLTSVILVAFPFISILLRRGCLDLAPHSASLAPSTNLCLNDPSRLVSFNGRDCRSAYWGILGLLIGVCAVPSGICFGIGAGRSFLVEIGWDCAGWTIFLAFAWLVGFPCVIRRGHDFGVPGWVTILLNALNLVPLIGWLLGLIVFIVWGCIDSTQGKNCYGPDPKAKLRTFVPRTII